MFRSILVAAAAAALLMIALPSQAADADLKAPVLDLTDLYLEDAIAGVDYVAPMLDRALLVLMLCDTRDDYDGLNTFAPIGDACPGSEVPTAPADNA